MHSILRAVATIACLGAASCMSISTMGLARTMPKGTVQGFLAPNYARFANEDSRQMNWQLEGGLRYSVTDFTEVGGRVWATAVTDDGKDFGWYGGGSLDTKFSLARSADPMRGFNAALAPSLGIAGTGGSGSGVVMLNLALPLLLGIDFGGHELVIGPRLMHQTIMAVGPQRSGDHVLSEPVNLLYLGSSLGLAIRITPGFRIMPEVSFAYPLLLWSGGESEGNRSSAVYIQLGVGLLFGGTDDKPRSP